MLIFFLLFQFAHAFECQEGSEFSQTTFSETQTREATCLRSGVSEGPLEITDLVTGRIIYKGKVKDGKPEGEFSKFDSDGTLKSKGTYTSGKMSGLWSRYYKNGTVLDEVNWKDGVPEGEYKKFNEKNELVESGFFECGQRTGSWTETNPESHERSEKKYRPEFTCNRFKLLRLRSYLNWYFTNFTFGYFSPSLSWAPTYRLSDRFQLQGEFAANFVKNKSTSSLTYGLSNQLFLKYLPGDLPKLRFEAGGGILTWLGFQTFPLLTLQTSYDGFFGLRLLGSFTHGFSKPSSIQVFRLGLEFSL